MAKKYGWSFKPLTPKQAAQLKAGFKVGGGEISVWDKKSNENTLKDLKRFVIYQIQEALDEALKTGKHTEQLLALRVMANTAQTAQEQVFKATKKEAKNRERVSALVDDLELAVSRFDNSTGFDLFNKETW
jgi:hypothetical protein